MKGGENIMDTQNDTVQTADATETQPVAAKVKGKPGRPLKARPAIETLVAQGENFTVAGLKAKHPAISDFELRTIVRNAATAQAIVAVGTEKTGQRGKPRSIYRLA